MTGTLREKTNKISPDRISCFIDKSSILIAFFPFFKKNHNTIQFANL